MIEQLPQQPEGQSLIVWIIGGFVAAIGGMFAFIKWLVGIQVKDIKALREEVGELKDKITINDTEDSGVKNDIVRLEKDIEKINKKIDNHISTDIKNLQDQIDELKK